MHLLTQSFPITGQTVDKFLSLDPLSLALIIIVIVVAVDFVKSWFKGRSTAATDSQQTAVIKFFTDEKSPMVISNNRVAAAVEQSNKRSEEQTAALVALGSKTDVQTGELSKQTNVIQVLSADFRSYQSTASDAMQENTKSLDSLIVKVDTQTENANDMKASIDRLTQQIEELIAQRGDCQDIKADWNKFQSSFFERFQQTPVPAVSNVTVNTGSLPPNVTPDEEEAALPKAS